MINFQNNITRDWLRKISLKGRLLSIDELEKSAQPQSYPLNGFAIISARNEEEVHSMLEECPDIDLSKILIYRMGG